MDISRILIVLIVFLVMWKETLNQEIKPGEELKERNKRYHESDQDEYLSTKQSKKTKNTREKKYIQTDTVNSRPDLQIHNRPVNAMSAKGNMVMGPQKIIKSRTAKHIANNHKPYIMYVPNYSPNDIITKRENPITRSTEAVKENKHVVKEVQEEKEKEQVVDIETIDKAFITKEKDLQEKLEKSLEESTNAMNKEPEVIKKKSKSKSKKKENKIKEMNNKENEEPDIKPPVIKKISKNHWKNDVIPITESNTDESKLDEKVTADVVIEKDSKGNTINTEKINVVLPKEDNKTQPRRHPFLDAIQNDLYISCPVGSEPNIANEDKQTKSTFVLDSPQKVNHTEDIDDKEELIVKNNNFEEVVEVSPPIAPVNYQYDRAQSIMSPNSCRNYCQSPNNYYQAPARPLFNYKNKFTPNEQRKDHVNGASVVSYNNYYKPTGNSNSYIYKNQNYYPVNNNGYYLNSPSQTYSYPSQRQNRGYVWRDNTSNAHSQAANNAKDTIRRSWKNTEYYIKSKNALKQIGHEQFYNLINQNNMADKMKYFQRNAELNGNYRKQNTAPYL